MAGTGCSPSMLLRKRIQGFKRRGEGLTLGESRLLVFSQDSPRPWHRPWVGRASAGPAVEPQPCPRCGAGAAGGVPAAAEETGPGTACAEQPFSWGAWSQEEHVTGPPVWTVRPLPPSGRLRWDPHKFTRSFLAAPSPCGRSHPLVVKSGGEDMMKPPAGALCSSPGAQTNADRLPLPLAHTPCEERRSPSGAPRLGAPRLTAPRCPAPLRPAAPAWQGGGCRGRLLGAAAAREGGYVRGEGGGGRRSRTPRRLRRRRRAAAASRGRYRGGRMCEVGTRPPLAAERGEPPGGATAAERCRDMG